MDFEHLQRHAWTEDELCKYLTTTLHNNFDVYQGNAWFFKLKRLKNGYMRIAWAKEFNSTDACMDYFFDTKYDRACVRIIFKNNKYQIYCHGYNFFDHYLIYKDLTEWTPRIKAFKNFEHMEMPPQKLLKAAFNEIGSELSSF